MKCKNFKPKEAITYFVDSYVTYYESYPEITAIIHAYEGLMREPDLSDKVKTIFNNRTNNIQSLIDEGKRLREFQIDLDSENLTDIIIGLERVIILKWRMNNYNFSLKEHTLSTLKMVLDVFTK